MTPWDEFGMCGFLRNPSGHLQQTGFTSTMSRHGGSGVYRKGRRSLAEAAQPCETSDSLQSESIEEISFGCFLGVLFAVPPAATMNH